MADRRRLVTFDAGGRPVVELDLEASSTYQAIRDTFAHVPGQQNQQGSREPGRYGGQVIVGEANDNATVSWQALVRGNTYDQVAGNIEALIAAANRTAFGRKLEWRPDGATYSSYFRIAGPATWKPLYKWSQWQGAQSMVVEVSFPVRPLVDWDPMTIGDPFDLDTSSDYTVDAAGGTTTITGGTVTASTNLGVERRWRHTIRGYKLSEGAATVKSTPGATITSYKTGVLLRGSASDTYVEVYVDDNGTNSRLRIDLVVAGVRTNKATTNLAGRVSNGTAHWVRGRIDGQTVTAEHFTAKPTPAGTATTSTSYTLTGGEPASLPAGFTGFSWSPQHASATLDDFEARPFNWTRVSLPQAFAPADQIPGTAPALVDVLASVPGPGLPVWAMFAWGRPAGSAAAPSPLSIVEADSMTPAGGISSSSQAGARGGFDMRGTTSGAAGYFLETPFASFCEQDDFADGTADIEVWGRVLVSSSNVNPRCAVYLSTGGQAQYSFEYGVTGKLILKPTSGTVYRWTRLGTLQLDVLSTATINLGVILSAETGSTGVLGLDYLMVCPARRRASGITGVAGTRFMPNDSAEWTKRVRSDLSATAESHGVGATGASRDAGLGGALIQPSPGLLRLLAKFSSDFPDDPTMTVNSDTLAYTTTVRLDVTPRSYLMRSG